MAGKQAVFHPIVVLPTALERSSRIVVVAVTTTGPPEFTCQRYFAVRVSVS